MTSDEVMEVVSEKLGATLAAVAIKNGEKLYLKLRLLAAVRLYARLFQVEHD